MIRAFVDAYMANKEQLRATFTAAHPGSYRDVVAATIGVLAKTSDDDYHRPDPARIHEIDDGDYQGTLVYIIGADGYQPSTYWSVLVGYGSRSGCDTLEAIRGYDDPPPSPEQVEQYLTLALHIVQGLHRLGAEADE